jgi:hypothetical protein
MQRRCRSISQCDGPRPSRRKSRMNVPAILRYTQPGGRAREINLPHIRWAEGVCALFSGCTLCSSLYRNSTVQR